MWLSPPGPGSYYRNNEQLFCSVSANQTRFTLKNDSGGQGRVLARSFSVSYIHTNTHTLSNLLHMSPVHRGHHGNLVFHSEWLGCFDGVLTKEYWSTWFDACYKGKHVLLPLWDLKKSLETNLINLYSSIFRVHGLYLNVISGLLFVPVDHFQPIWLCFVNWVCMHMCLSVPWVLPVVMSMQQRWFMNFSVAAEKDNSHYIFSSFQHSMSHS